MSTKKKSASKNTSSKKATPSGDGPKSRKTVGKKMQKTMHEYKHHELKSGRSGKNVKSRKQAIAIGLSEARRAGANVPPPRGKKKSTAKKTASKRKSSGSSGRKRAASRKRSS